MDKQAILQLLDQKHNRLVNWFKDQPDTKWETGPEGKWTTGQQVLHLLQSAKALNTGMSMPKFVLKWKFGKANREVRDYDAVVKRYHERLEESNVATFGPSANMKVPPLTEKQYLLNRIQVEHKKLQYKTQKWRDKDLDTIVLPHPLMGKMPVREIVMWTAYHIEHHAKQLEENY